jgi:hypothetical protein
MRRQDVVVPLVLPIEEEVGELSALDEEGILNVAIEWRPRGLID